jgi:hypothetical protein
MSCLLHRFGAVFPRNEDPEDKAASGLSAEAPVRGAHTWTADKGYGMSNKGKVWTGIACSACSSCHELYLADESEYREGIQMAYRCPATDRIVEWSTHSAFENAPERLGNVAELRVV